MLEGRTLLTPQERTLRAKLGAYTLHAKHDAKQTTAKGRATFLARFETEVDPEGTLTLAERQRRAQYARKAYFARLALLSAKTRRKKKERKENRSTKGINDETAGGTAVESLEVRDEASLPSE